MSNEEVLAAILTGIVMPFVISVASRYKWTSATRQLVAFGLTGVAAITVAVINGEVLSVPLVMATSVSIYQMLNKTGVFSSLEYATSGKVDGSDETEVDDTVPEHDAPIEPATSEDEELDAIQDIIEEETKKAKPIKKKSTNIKRDNHLGGGANG